MQVVWENNAAGIYRNYTRIKEIKRYFPHGPSRDALPTTVEDKLVTFGTKVNNLCSEKLYLQKPYLIVSKQRFTTESVNK